MRAIAVAVETIVSEIEKVGVPGLSAAELGDFMGDVAQRASELVLVEHLQTYVPVVFTVLHFFGVVEVERANVGVPDMQLVEYERKRLRFDRIEKLLTDPGALVRDLYGGDADAHGAALIGRLAAMLQVLACPRRGCRSSPQAAGDLVLLIDRTQGVNPPGLDAELTFGLTDGFALELPLADGLLADISARGALSASTGISIRPPADIVDPTLWRRQRTGWAGFRLRSPSPPPPA